MEHFKQELIEKIDEQIMDLENIKNCINGCDDEKAVLNAIDDFSVMMKIDDADRNFAMVRLYNYCKIRIENRKKDNND